MDGLRGIAALSVVLFHFTGAGRAPILQEALPTWPITLIEHGNLGVAIFFVLSGFVIAHSLYSQRVTFTVANQFLMRRSLRWTRRILSPSC